MSHLERPFPNEPIDQAVARFFAALLASDGELSRYVAPDTDLSAIEPPPFAAIELLGIGTEPREEATLVRALVQGSDSAGRRQVLEYWLEVAECRGRWEVVRLTPVAVLEATP